MDVEFNDLTYTVQTGSAWKSKVPKKLIMKGVSGRFKPGQLSAIMGPSGAGKTSLLHALSGYRSAGVGGSLYTNGRPRDERVFRKCSCYITQDDILQPLLTLKELMMFAARLKLPSDTTLQQRHDVVSEIISKLGLSTSERTRTEKLSGGEKKRLLVGLELINNPPVFFLDEPTSGMDNVSAKHCLQMLRSLAQQGRTIVCTIHQPSASLFQLFDHVYVVAQGLCVYQGSTSGLIPFLSAVGLDCPLSYNPADFIIEVTEGEANHVQTLSIAIGNGQNSIQSSTNKMISDKPRNNKLEDLDNDEKLAPIGSVLNLDLNNPDIRSLGFPASSWTQFTTLLARMFLQIRRNKTSLWIQLIHHVLCSSMFGVVFFNFANSAHRWTSHFNCVLGIITFHSYTWCMVPVLTYPNEVKLLKREHFNGLYSFKSYFLALTLSTLPAKIVFGWIFSTITYFTWGVPFDLERYLIFCLIGIITSMTTEGLGYAIGSTFSITNGACIGPACLALFLNCSVYGFDFAAKIPIITKIILQLSFLRSGVVSLILTVFGLERQLLDCDDSFDYCHFRDPEVLITMFDLVGRSVWSEILFFCGHLLTFRILFYVLLRRRLKS